MELLRKIQECCNKKNYERMYYGGVERVLDVEIQPKAIRYSLPESSSSSSSSVDSSASISDDSSMNESEV